MATAIQIRRGIQRYVNEELVQNMTGWQQFAAATALGAIVPQIKSDVDIEPIYHSAKEQFAARPAGVTLTKADMVQMHPVIGAIAGSLMDSITFREGDLDKLYRYITEG